MLRIGYGECNERRGGVKVYHLESARVERLSPHPVSHLAMRADAPPPGEGKKEPLTFALETIVRHAHNRAD
jgi:hypothetical protein